MRTFIEQASAHGQGNDEQAIEHCHGGRREANLYLTAAATAMSSNEWR